MPKLGPYYHPFRSTIRGHIYFKDTFCKPLMTINYNYETTPIKGQFCWMKKCP